MIRSKILLIGFLVASSLYASNAEDLIDQNGCLACHAVASKKAAPAFKGTARKNLKWYSGEAKLKIIDSIKNGSKGKYRQFSDTSMPAYKHLSDTDLDKIANWILDLYRNNINRGNNRQGRNF